MEDCWFVQAKATVSLKKKSKNKSLICFGVGRIGSRNSCTLVHRPTSAHLAGTGAMASHEAGSTMHLMQLMKNDHGTREEFSESLVSFARAELFGLKCKFARTIYTVVSISEDGKMELRNDATGKIDTKPSKHLVGGLVNYLKSKQSNEAMCADAQWRFLRACKRVMDRKVELKDQLQKHKNAITNVSHGDLHWYYEEKERLQNEVESFPKTCAYQYTMSNTRIHETIQALGWDITLRQVRTRLESDAPVLHNVSHRHERLAVDDAKLMAVVLEQTGIVPWNPEVHTESVEGRMATDMMTERRERITVEFVDKLLRPLQPARGDGDDDDDDDDDAGVPESVYRATTPPMPAIVATLTPERQNRIRATSRTAVRQLAGTTSSRGTPGGEQLLRLREARSAAQVDGSASQELSQGAASSSQDVDNERRDWINKTNVIVGNRLAHMPRLLEESNAEYDAVIALVAECKKRKQEQLHNEEMTLHRVQALNKAEMSHDDAIRVFHVAEAIGKHRPTHDLDHYIDAEDRVGQRSKNNDNKTKNLRLSGNFIRAANTVSVTSDEGQAVLAAAAAAVKQAQKQIQADKHYKKQSELDALANEVQSFVNNDEGEEAVSQRQRPAINATLAKALCKQIAGKVKLHDPAMHAMAMNCARTNLKDGFTDKFWELAQQYHHRQRQNASTGQVEPTVPPAPTAATSARQRLDFSGHQ